MQHHRASQGVLGCTTLTFFLPQVAKVAQFYPTPATHKTKKKNGHQKKTRKTNPPSKLPSFDSPPEAALLNWVIPQRRGSNAGPAASHLRLLDYAAEALRGRRLLGLGFAFTRTCTSASATTILCFLLLTITISICIILVLAATTHQ